MEIRADEEGLNRRRRVGSDGSMMGRGCCSPPTSGSMTAAGAAGVTGGCGVRDAGGGKGAGIAAAIIGGDPSGDRTGADGVSAIGAEEEGAGGCSPGGDTVEDVVAVEGGVVARVAGDCSKGEGAAVGAQDSISLS